MPSPDDVSSFLGVTPTKSESTGESAAVQWKIAYDLHHRRNDLAGAEAGYRTLIDEHPQSDEAKWARTQLAVLGVEVPLEPPPAPTENGAEGSGIFERIGARVMGGDSGPTPSDGAFIERLKRRYSDAFVAAHATIGVGKVVKGVAITVAILGLPLGSDVGRSSKDIGALVVALFIGIGIPIYILGILVKSRGQSQLAELDTAVNSSRHLSDDDVKDVLSKSLFK